MKPEDKKKWIEALRSGKYKQGEGQLRRTQRDGQQYHCCLGVLCEITKEVTWYNDRAGFDGFVAACVLPTSVSEKYEIKESPQILIDIDPDSTDLNVSDHARNYLKEWLDTDNEVSLWRLNDHGFSFEDIAELIEHCELV